MSAAATGPFHTLQHRNFRLFWFGFIISNAGAWIQSVAQGWLVYQISGSAVWLGAIGFVRAFPLIFLSLVGGTVADRFSKRTILFITQGVQTFAALALGILTTMGTVQVWHVIALSALSSAAQAFDNPTRQALLPHLVNKADLHAAISLNAIAFNGAAAFGPSLTGVLVPLVGLAGCFYINAVSFAAVFVALLIMEFPPQTAAAAGSQRPSMSADLMAGVRYVARSPVMLALISMAAVNSFFARPFQQFLTVFAADVHQGGVGLAGLMQAAPSVGTIIFMLGIASLGRIRYKGWLLLGSGLAFALALIAFAWAPNVYLALGLLVLVGGFSMTSQTTTNALLQEHTSDEMRGRVMATYTITALGMMPLGQGPMGWMVQQWGPQNALTVGAAISLAWVAYMGLLRVRVVRDLT